MTYKLPKLPYAFNALEPAISAESLKLHYTAHHQKYVDNLNDALKDYPRYQQYSPEILVTNWKKLPKVIRETVRNNAGGDVNHTLFWLSMAEKGGGTPTGKLLAQINKDFGSFEKFKKKFNEAAGKLFGSGWTWLIFNGEKLMIVTLPNQDSPLTNSDFPILGIDCWEHAWAYQYENKKDKYFDAIWSVWDWDNINARFEKAKLLASRKPVKTIVQKQYSI